MAFIFARLFQLSFSLLLSFSLEITPSAFASAVSRRVSLLPFLGCHRYFIFDALMAIFSALLRFTDFFITLHAELSGYYAYAFASFFAAISSLSSFRDVTFWLFRFHAA